MIDRLTDLRRWSV